MGKLFSQALSVSTPPLDCSDCPFREHTIYVPSIKKHPRMFAVGSREIITVPARRILVGKGEVPNKILTLFKGWAYRYNLLPDGRRQILTFKLPGDFISLRALQLSPMNFAVRTITEATLCSIDAVALREKMGDPAQASHLVRAYMQMCVAADHRLLALSRRNAIERVAGLILDIEHRLAERSLTDGDTFEFPLRQEHIADALDLTSVHVSRTMSSLRRAGVISLDHGTMTIMSRSALLEMAGDPQLDAGHQPQFRGQAQDGQATQQN